MNPCANTFVLAETVYDNEEEMRAAVSSVAAGTTRSRDPPASVFLQRCSGAVVPRAGPRHTIVPCYHLLRSVQSFAAQCLAFWLRQ